MSVSVIKCVALLLLLRLRCVTSVSPELGTFGDVVVGAVPPSAGSRFAEVPYCDKIQDALKLVANGGRIMVHRGLYTECELTVRRNVTLTSLAGHFPVVQCLSPRPWLIVDEANVHVELDGLNIVLLPLDSADLYAVRRAVEVRGTAENAGAFHLSMSNCNISGQLKIDVSEHLSALNMVVHESHFREGGVDLQLDARIGGSLDVMHSLFSVSTVAPGLLVSGNLSVHVSSSIFRGTGKLGDMMDGGALAVYGLHDVSITDSVFHYCVATRQGGAVFLKGSRRVFVARNSFRSNRVDGQALDTACNVGSSDCTCGASCGGSLCIQDLQAHKSGVYVESNSYTSNKVKGSEGKPAYGGAVYMYGDQPDGVETVVSGNAFAKCSATGGTGKAAGSYTTGGDGGQCSGGALYYYAVGGDGKCPLLVVDNVFRMNVATAGDGGSGDGYWATGGTGGMSQGGGCFCSNWGVYGPMVFRHNVFADNVVHGGDGGDGGDGVHGTGGNAGLGSGGGLASTAEQWGDIPIALENCTFHSNSAIGGNGGSSGRYGAAGSGMDGRGGGASLISLDPGVICGVLVADSRFFSNSVRGGAGGTCQYLCNGGRGGPGAGGGLFLQTTQGTRNAIFVKGSNFSFNCAYGGAGGDVFDPDHGYYEGRGEGYGGDGGKSMGGAIWASTGFPDSPILMERCNLSSSMILGGRGGSVGARGAWGVCGSGGLAQGGCAYAQTDWENSTVSVVDGVFLDCAATPGSGGFGWVKGDDGAGFGGALIILSRDAVVCRVVFRRNVIAASGLHSGIGGALGIRPSMAGARFNVTHNWFMVNGLAVGGSGFGGALSIGNEVGLRSCVAWIVHNEFVSNYMVSASMTCGGAISASGMNVSLSENTYAGNSGSGVGAVGGALCLDAGFPLATDVCFDIRNETFANDSVTGFQAGGGAMGFPAVTASLYAWSSNASTVFAAISGVRFQHNHADSGDGGALYVQPGFHKLHLSVEGCTFDSNSAVDGGSCYLADATDVVVSNCTFSSNSASVLGGAVVLASDSTLLTSSTFTRNSAGLSGGAVAAWVEGDDVSNSTLWNNTYSSNWAMQGGAVYGEMIGTRAGSTLLISDETFLDNSAISRAGTLSFVLGGANVTVQRPVVRRSVAPLAAFASVDLRDSVASFALGECDVVADASSSDGSQISVTASAAQTVFYGRQNRFECPVGHNYTKLSVAYGPGDVSTVVSCIRCAGGIYPGGSYLMEESGLPDRAQLECLSCPMHAECEGGSEVHSLPGHGLVQFASANSYGVTQTTVDSMLCAEGYCCSSRDKCKESSCMEEDGSETRTGLLCGECAAGYCRALGGQCVDCSQCGTASSVLAFVFSNLFLVTGVVVFRILFPGNHAAMKILDYFFQMLPVTSISQTEFVLESGRFARALGSIARLASVLSNLESVKSIGSANCPVRNMGLGTLFVLDLMAPFMYFVAFAVISVLCIILVHHIEFVRYLVSGPFRLTSFCFRKSKEHRAAREATTGGRSESGVETAKLLGVDELSELQDLADAPVYCPTQQRELGGPESARDDGDSSVDADRSLDVDAGFASSSLGGPLKGGDIGKGKEVERINWGVGDGAPVLSPESDSEDELGVDLPYTAKSGTRDDPQSVSVEGSDAAKDSAKTDVPLWLRGRAATRAYSRRFTLAWMTILLESYRSFLTVCFTYLQCRRITIGEASVRESRLLWYTAQKCYAWWQWFLWVGLFVVLVPCPVLILLYRYGVRLLYVGSGKSTSRDRGKSGVKRQATLDILEQAYQSGRKFWESVLLGRRLVLLLVVFFVSDLFARGVVVAMCCFVFGMMHLLFRPFRGGFVNFLEGLSLLFLSLLAVLKVGYGQLEQLGQQQDNSLALALYFLELFFAATISICVLCVMSVHFFRRNLLPFARKQAGRARKFAKKWN